MKKQNPEKKQEKFITPGIVISFLIVIASYVLAIYFYPLMPETMASHWGLNGQVNGYISRFWGVMLLPIVSTVLFVLFMILPKIDPKKQNIEKFRKYFDMFSVMIFLFLTYIYALTLMWNMGYTFSMNVMIAPPFAVLFYFVGVLLKHAEMNWTIGIRTPWTLESPAVWKQTHKVGSILFKICGLISLIGVLLPAHTFWFILVPIITVSLFIVVYSYVLFRNEKKR
jgi:uncharacterized membrane protein